MNKEQTEQTSVTGTIRPLPEQIASAEKSENGKSEFERVDSQRVKKRD